MGARKKGGKKGQQSAHNKQTGKYAKQKSRTEANKKKRKAKHEAMKKKK